MCLEEGDNRRIVVNVAGPAALLVAKTHKIGEMAPQDAPTTHGERRGRRLPPLRRNGHGRHVSAS